ncbi:hypothetical protein [Cohnella thailandensis]|jgi:hypothetical protein|uniref:Uncharacterized protein n=1 Tax=Cohnella thailandensis TaxID=557557 RepID=A0A841T2W2_9BACL|nr:hypothetical protein [Cohnella thailandensis]MBB6636217.1 hypothetical protein [Cohnella thailandensis]MBP1973814.1 hypothetical protein [Cohnella thailandensis]
MTDILHFGSRTVPLLNRAKRLESRRLLQERMKEMTLDLEFRRKWKKVTNVELWSDAAIFKFSDGTKLYLNIS